MKHSKSNYVHITGQDRSEKTQNLINYVTPFTKQKHQNVAAVRASLEIRHMLAKPGKPID